MARRHAQTLSLTWGAEERQFCKRTSKNKAALLQYGGCFLRLVVALCRGCVHEIKHPAWLLVLTRTRKVHYGGIKAGCFDPRLCANPTHLLLCSYHRPGRAAPAAFPQGRPCQAGPDDGACRCACTTKVTCRLCVGGGLLQLAWVAKLQGRAYCPMA